MKALPRAVFGNQSQKLHGVRLPKPGLGVARLRRAHNVKTLVLTVPGNSPREFPGKGGLEGLKGGHFWPDDRLSGRRFLAKLCARWVILRSLKMMSRKSLHSFGDFFGGIDQIDYPRGEEVRRGLKKGSKKGPFLKKGQKPGQFLTWF